MDMLRRAALLAFVTAPAILSPAAAQDRVEPWEVYVACRQLDQIAGAAALLRDFCTGTRLPNDLAGWALSGHAAWTDKARIPPPEMVRGAARQAAGLVRTSGAPLMSAKGFPKDFGLGAAAAADLSAGPVRPAPSYSGTSAVLVGITDALIAEAHEEFQIFMLTSVLTQICDPERVRFRHTCLLFDGDVGRTYIPTITTLRAALRADLAEVPMDLARAYFLSEIPDTLPSGEPTSTMPDGSAVEAWWAAKLPRARLAIVGMYVLDALESYSAGNSLHSIWNADPEWLDTRLEVHARLRRDPVMAGILSFHDAAGEIETARAQLARYAPGGVPADTAVLYALRAMAVNRDSLLVSEELKLRTLRVVVASYSGAAEALAAADSIRRRLRDVEMTATDSLAGPRRRALHAESLWLTAQAPLAVLHAVAQTDPDLQRWADLSSGLIPELVTIRTAAVNGEYRSALRGLASAVARFDELSGGNRVACLRRVWVEESVSSCPTSTASRFSPRDLALLAFAADVAQAKDEVSVQRAFRGYVRQQRGRAEKRLGTPWWYWAVNAYVGGQTGSETLNPGEAVHSEGSILGAYIPLGLELGVRRGGWTLGLLGQLVDLGAIATYRQDGDNPDEDLENNLQPQQIVSTGLGVALGLGPLPFSVGHMWTYMPDARKWTGVGTVDARRSFWFVAVDLPLFN